MTTKPKQREFKEVEGGKYDDLGFYRTPNGSFWDPDGIYFNKEGKDSHGGYYDNNFEYHPGDGWIDSMMCYQDELEDKRKESNYDDDDLDEGDYEDGDYDVYEDYNDDLKEGMTGQSYYEIHDKKISSNVKGNVEKKEELKKSDNVKEVKEALKTNNKVECQGFQISNDLDD
jgi:hypothetical protein